jgi:hypothetical protein
LELTDLNEQTASGQLQFQNEGAEHFLKDIQLRSIDYTVPGAPKPQAIKMKLH